MFSFKFHWILPSLLLFHSFLHNFFIKEYACQLFPSILYYTPIRAMLQVRHGYFIIKNEVISILNRFLSTDSFDVLLVFMFDRLGRKEDETPFLVKWFVDHGIEVWSTREGQQRLDNQVDRLMNYMRFWAASGESEKTSLRVKAAHKQMTEDGVWRGGGCPYGYKLVRLGRIGKETVHYTTS